MNSCFVLTRDGLMIAEWYPDHPGVLWVQADDRVDLPNELFVRTETPMSSSSPPIVAHSKFSSIDNLYHWTRTSVCRRVHTIMEVDAIAWYPEVIWNDIVIEAPRWPHNNGSGKIAWIRITIAGIRSYIDLKRARGAGARPLDEPGDDAQSIRADWNDIVSRLDKQDWVVSDQEYCAHGRVNVSDLELHAGDPPADMLKHLQQTWPYV